MWCDVEFPKRLNSLQSYSLEVPFSREDIQHAVWDCGSDRASGPDGFFFPFWLTIEDVVVYL